MRPNRFQGLAAVGIVGLATIPTPTLAAEIDVARLPAVVRRAADRAIPGARWSEALAESGGGQLSYEINGTNADGDDVGVVVTARGQLTEVDTEVEMTEVPKVVRAALRDRVPRFRAESVMAVNQRGRVVGYEFEGKLDRETEEVYVSTDGRTVEFEDD